MRFAFAIVLLAAGLSSAAPASARTSPLTDRYLPLEVEATWTAEGTGKRCFGDGECVFSHEGNRSGFSQVWSQQPAESVNVSQEPVQVKGDKATVSCPTDRPPEQRPPKPGGELALEVKPGGGAFDAQLAFGCIEMHALLTEIGAPTGVKVHRELSQVQAERDIRIVDDGTKTYTGTTEEGRVEWTVVVTWHIKVRYATECTGVTRYASGSFTKVWGKAPFCLFNQTGTSYACGLEAARKGNAHCGSAKLTPLHDVLCSHVKKSEIAGLLGNPARTYSDHPTGFCALQGRRGQVLANRAEDEPLYRPSAQEISFAKLLQAGGYAHYKLTRTGGGRLLQVLGSRPWVANWYGYRKGQTLWLAGVPGDQLEQKIAGGISRVASHILARL